MIILVNPDDQSESYGPFLEMPVLMLKKLGFVQEVDLWVKRTRQKEFKLKVMKPRHPDQLKAAVGCPASERRAIASTI